MMKYTGFDIDECDLISDLMPLSAKSVDILACYSVIEHLHDPSNLLTEAKRVLKPDGYFLLKLQIGSTAISHSMMTIPMSSPIPRRV